MKAIIMMFDTLTRKYLSAYGNEWVHTPEFKRLEAHTVTFDNFYAASLPCMPARRDLHTGRCSFLHRMWGPLEPFDVSVMERLKEHGIYTHLVTDHSHYWEDGGATYHNRYSTWEGFRGQEGDRWKPSLGENPVPPLGRLSKTGDSVRQNWTNRRFQPEERDMPSVKTVTAGLDFIKEFHEKDDWLLQIECFDPHEPFICPQEYRQLYEDEYEGAVFDWPAYRKTDSAEDRGEVDHIRKQYASLISMCDRYLGKVLDAMDRYGLWRDTMLIVNTDHGFLLGEHDWMGKNIQPAYDEIAHLPFFIWDPRYKKMGERRDCLAQTIDIAPTLMDFFGLEADDTMDGRSLIPVLADEKPVRETAVFGIHGGHVNVTDGKYVYMKCASSEVNQPLYNYTLMPTAMRGFIPQVCIDEMELTDGGRYSHGSKVLKIPCRVPGSSSRYGNLLFEAEDGEQKNNLADGGPLEQQYRTLLIRCMEEMGAPKEQFVRLGLDARQENRNNTALPGK